MSTKEELEKLTVCFLDLKLIKTTKIKALKRLEILFYPKNIEINKSNDGLFNHQVAQLKEKLKSRKMATSGAKTDLINRLYESIMTEEKLLEEGPGGETIDLSSVNMDEVKGQIFTIGRGDLTSKMP